MRGNSTRAEISIHRLVLKIRRLPNRRIPANRTARRRLIPNPNRERPNQQHNHQCRNSEDESKIVFSHAHTFLPPSPSDVKQYAPAPLLPKKYFIKI